MIELAISKDIIFMNLIFPATKKLTVKVLILTNVIANLYSESEIFSA
jgi:hypothetical protein